MQENNADRYAEIAELILGHVAAAADVDPAGLSEETNFVESALLDSFGIMNLILELELSLQIKFNPVDLSRDEARTVGGLARLAAECGE
jgi:acyl carrier protein